jgi:hypothetical protein
MSQEVNEAFQALTTLSKKHPLYWQIVDCIPQQELVKYVDTLAKTRLLPSNDWWQACSIASQFKTDRFITTKQHRWCVMLVVANWRMLLLEIERQEFQKNLTSGFM